MFRAVPLALLALWAARRRHAGRWMAAGVVVTALVFGFGHANYPSWPAYSRGAELFPLRPDPSAATYWAERAPAPYVFELDAEDVSGWLRARWEAEGLAELAALAEELGALSRELEQKVVNDESPEISPFVYAMF